jgi:TPP-dependent trihydroxycyclohexane-1,2-dione (THcHDO) dehydratase
VAVGIAADVAHTVEALLERCAAKSPAAGSRATSACTTAGRATATTTTSPALAAPGRDVWALVGDGGFQMSMQDLATIADRKLPVKVLLYGNGQLAFVKMEMEAAGFPYLRAAIDTRNPDFVALAHACGWEAGRVESADHIGPVMDAAAAARGTFLIDAKGDPRRAVAAAAHLAQAGLGLRHVRAARGGHPRPRGRPRPVAQLARRDRGGAVAPPCLPVGVRPPAGRRRTR